MKTKSSFIKKFGRKNCYYCRHASKNMIYGTFHSYTTMVGVYDEWNNVAYITNKKFSVTTSKHLSLFKNKLCCAHTQIIEVDHENLEVIRKKLSILCSK